MTIPSEALSSQPPETSDAESEDESRDGDHRDKGSDRHRFATERRHRDTLLISAIEKTNRLTICEPAVPREYIARGRAEAQSR